MPDLLVISAEYRWEKYVNMGQTPSSATSVDTSKKSNNENLHTTISRIENRPTKMRFRLPVELIAEVAHWLHDSECAELDPVSKTFDSYTRGRALDWLAIKV